MLFKVNLQVKVVRRVHLLLKTPRNHKFMQKMLWKGSPGALECILGPEPCPKVTPTLSLVPAASSSLGWDSPRDAEGVEKKDSAEFSDCGVGPANHPPGEGTGDRPRGLKNVLPAMPK